MSRIPPRGHEDAETRTGGERHSLLRLLVEASRALEWRLHEGLRAAGCGDVRPAHYAAFRHLKPQGARVTELAEAAGMTQQSMGELVDHLEGRGYVERRPDPRDGRAKIVVATEAGRRGIGAAAERLAEIEDALAGHMGEARFEELVEALEELTALLVELPDETSGSTYGGS